MTEADRTSVAGALETVLTACTAGRSRVVLIEGGAGCGKTHLLNAVAERAAAAGALLLTAAATESERGAPLGVLRQLVGGAPVLALPRTGADDAVPSEEAMRTFCAQLCTPALDRPVVLCVDDVQYADAQSLHHLRHLARHARPARVLLVATVSAYAAHIQEPLFTPEPAGRHVRRIRLGPLAPEETARAAAAPPQGWPAPGRPGRPPSELHGITGGNPLLLRALLQEDGAAVQPPAPAPDGPFAEAVLDCLRRSGPGAEAVARAVAALAAWATEPLVARMLHRPGTDVPSPAGHDVPGALNALRACGLLEGLRFRHPSVPTAVLAGVPPRMRGDLRRRAAHALHEAGAPAEAVAGHLLAPPADGRRSPARPEDFTLLVETAHALLAPGPADGPDLAPRADTTADAERLLELAHGVCPDEDERAAVALSLVRTGARRHPAVGEARLTAWVTGPRSARPSGWDPREPAALLLAQGRIAEACALLRTEDPGAEDRWVVGTLLDAPAGECETLLGTVPLTDTSFARLVNAVRALLYSDRSERAVSPSRGLLAQAERSGAPGWRAVCAALYAEALLRTGDAHGARRHATAALDALPTCGGGAFPYGPAATLVQACAALGHHDEATRHAQRPVTRQALTSLYGVQYLRARGLHRLSLGQPHTALADFRTAGRVVQSWQADRPAFLPWRTDAAQALLRMGRLGRARALAEEQLALPDAAHPRVRGACLRLLAATGSPGRRTALLGEAVDELRRAGDGLETVRALAELGHALHGDGRAAQGAAALRAAWNLAQQLGAVGFPEELLPVAGRPAVEVAAGEVPLNDAERRVAELPGRPAGTAPVRT
ncbi:AAA family ATPase [Streptomyces sp. NPDC049541]|uniref:AAA family ATPase n=1 Tax=Streptomyces sp. NPDC049541 TaxID=3365594 RepID=UPI0037921AE7